MENLSTHTKHLLDGLSMTAAIAAFFSWLSPVIAFLAALASLCWTVLRIVEMATGKTISELRKDWRSK